MQNKMQCIYTNFGNSLYFIYYMKWQYYSISYMQFCKHYLQNENFFNNLEKKE